jgi:hypothetical protein
VHEWWQVRGLWQGGGGLRLFRRRSEGCSSVMEDGGCCIAIFNVHFDSG